MLNAKAKKDIAAGIKIGVSGANTLHFVVTEWDTEAIYGGTALK